MSIQKAKLNHGVHILVATPGRLIDFIWNTKLDLTQVRTVVLDEADEMLNMGFIDDVDFILSCLLQDHQTLLFSATMPREIAVLADKYLTDPVRVELNRDRRAPQSLEHHFLHSVTTGSRPSPASSRATGSSRRSSSATLAIAAPSCMGGCGGSFHRWISSTEGWTRIDAPRFSTASGRNRSSTWSPRMWPAADSTSPT